MSLSWCVNSDNPEGFTGNCNPVGGSLSPQPSQLLVIDLKAVASHEAKGKELFFVRVQVS